MEIKIDKKAERHFQDLLMKNKLKDIKGFIYLFPQYRKMILDWIEDASSDNPKYEVDERKLEDNF